MANHFFASITRNWISLTGCALALVSALLIVILFVISLEGYQGGPYLGILAYLILPAFFVLGLILIPVGIYFERRRLRAHPEYEGRGPFPIIDLNSPRTRGALMIFLGLTVVNLVILAGATYEGIEVMESTEFCGESCHVMDPEYTAYKRSPHARVRCAECHIGPGADWFVKSKLDGSWQLVAVAFDLYPRPIPTPLHDLRPARETCEQCHWPAKFHGDRLQITRSYADDETNTELTSAVLLKVGGANGRNSVGIHWHVDPGNQVRYRSDESREKVYEVQLTQADGSETHWRDSKAPAEGGEWRTMDCVDCHNRPSHQYRQPGPEIDNAIHAGKIDRSLPFVKRESLRIIEQEYPSHEAARDTINQALKAFYQEQYPEVAGSQAAAIEKAGTALGDIYAENVFPEMKVWWNTYPNHIGHQQSPGCFRCHNRSMKSDAGEGISRRCTTCHTILADQEENPEFLSELGGG